MLICEISTAMRITWKNKHNTDRIETKCIESRKEKYKYISKTQQVPCNYLITLGLKSNFLPQKKSSDSLSRIHHTETSNWMRSFFLRTRENLLWIKTQEMWEYVMLLNELQSIFANVTERPNRFLRLLFDWFFNILCMLRHRESRFTCWISCNRTWSFVGVYLIKWIQARWKKLKYVKSSNGIRTTLKQEISCK